ncbi:MAG: DHHA1 domain-containing protein, partial [Bacillota bacterium]|nr:DHHA1 domain-containing protein [Bacillota bacterium]
CFKYSNTTARTLNIAAACYEAGINAAEINHEIFDSKTRARFDIERYVFENLRFYQDGKIALCTLPRQTIDNAEATEDDLENIAALPRQIKDVMIAITISETESGNSKVSVRTASGYDAASICSRFGGGGHERAAGGSLKGLPSANENTVLEAALQCIQE